VRHEIGPIATPDHLQWAPGLPKTRSGKIMRRILRKIAEDAPEQLGIRRRWPTRRWSNRSCAIAAAPDDAQKETRLPAGFFWCFEQ
jgi:hypothetical protein